jgi:tape measure domain-containing protein
MVGVVADRVIVELEARVAKYQRDVAQAAQRFDRGMARIEGSSRRMERNVNSSFQRAGSTIKRQVGAIVGALGIREVGLYADAWTSAGNKIAAASQVSGIQADELATLTKRATEARTAFEPYVDLYSRLLRSAGQVGASQTEVATATDIVAKSFKAGGAAAQEQAAGILQLGQALGSGFLQGDELRSLRENAPLLAAAIAEEFDTTIGGLKKLGEEGKLTSDKVFRAILAGQGNIEAAFAKTNSTIGDGFNNFRTALIRYIGDADDAVGATETLVAALNALAENLDIVAIAVGALAVRGIAPLVAALATRLAGAALTAVAALQLLTVSGGTAFVAMTAFRSSIALLGGPIGAALIAATGLAVAFSALDTGAASAAEGLEKLNGAIGKAKSTFADLQGVEQDLKSDTERLERANDALNDAVREGGDVAIATAEADVAAINRRIQGNIELREAILATLAAQQANLGATGITGPLQIVAGLFGAEQPDNSAEAVIDRQTAAIDRLRDAAREANKEGTTTQLQAEFLEAESAILSAEDAARKISEKIDAVRSGGAAGSAAPGAGVSISGTGKKGKENVFEKELKSLQDRSDAAAALISIQGNLNPIIDDYGVSLQTAALAADLLNKANEAGVKVDAQRILNLAEGVILLEEQADAARAFGSSVDGIKAVTREILSQNDALARINPLTRDYGFEIAAAEVEQRLLLEAQLAGIEITDELAAAIRRLAEEYGTAVAEGNELEDAQERLKEANAEFRDTAKSSLSGFISDLREGKSATEALANALQKVADKLLDIALDNLFSAQGPLGGGNSGTGGAIVGLLSTLFTSFAAKGGVFSGGRELPRFAGGGVSSSAAIFAEAGPEAAVPLPDGRRIPVDLNIPQMMDTRQAERSGDQVINLGGITINGVKNVDEFNESRVHVMAAVRRDLDRVKDRQTA